MRETRPTDNTVCTRHQTPEDRDEEESGDCAITGRDVSVNSDAHTGLDRTVNRSNESMWCDPRLNQMLAALSGAGPGARPVVRPRAVWKSLSAAAPTEAAGSELKVFSDSSDLPVCTQPTHCWKRRWQLCWRPVCFTHMLLFMAQKCFMAFRGHSLQYSQSQLHSYSIFFGVRWSPH